MILLLFIFFLFIIYNKFKKCNIDSFKSSESFNNIFLQEQKNIRDMISNIIRKNNTRIYRSQKTIHWLQNKIKKQNQDLTNIYNLDYHNKSEKKKHVKSNILNLKQRITKSRNNITKIRNEQHSQILESLKIIDNLIIKYTPKKPLHFYNYNEDHKIIPNPLINIAENKNCDYIKCETLTGTDITYIIKCLHTKINKIIDNAFTYLVRYLIQWFNKKSDTGSAWSFSKYEILSKIFEKEFNIYKEQLRIIFKKRIIHRVQNINFLNPGINSTDIINKFNNIIDDQQPYILEESIKLFNNIIHKQKFKSFLDKMEQSDIVSIIELNKDDLIEDVFDHIIITALYKLKLLNLCII